MIDNKFELWIDIRVPAKLNNQDIIDGMQKLVRKNYECHVHSNSKSLYFDRESFLVKTLMQTYQDVTGDFSLEPKAIGGGTYAKQTTNCVAFGALLPSQAR